MTGMVDLDDHRAVAAVLRHLGRQPDAPAQALVDDFEHVLFPFYLAHLIVERKPVVDALLGLDVVVLEVEQRTQRGCSTARLGRALTRLGSRA